MVWGKGRRSTSPRVSQADPATSRSTASRAALAPRRTGHGAAWRPQGLPRARNSRVTSALEKMGARQEKPRERMGGVNPSLEEMGPGQEKGQGCPVSYCSMASSPSEGNVRSISINWRAGFWCGFGLQAFLILLKMWNSGLIIKLRQTLKGSSIFDIFICRRFSNYESVVLTGINPLEE